MEFKNAYFCLQQIFMTLLHFYGRLFMNFWIYIPQKRNIDFFGNKKPYSSLRNWELIW